MKDTTTTTPRTKHSSWRLPADVADRLAAVVDDIHFATRRPKQAIHAAVVAVALEHQPEILARLAPGGES
jgi:hypothetical protein